MSFQNPDQKCTTWIIKTKNNFLLYLCVSGLREKLYLSFEFLKIDIIDPNGHEEVLFSPFSFTMLQERVTAGSITAVHQISD